MTTNEARSAAPPPPRSRSSSASSSTPRHRGDHPKEDGVLFGEGKSGNPLLRQAREAALRILRIGYARPALREASACLLRKRVRERNVDVLRRLKRRRRQQGDDGGDESHGCEGDAPMVVVSVEDRDVADAYEGALRLGRLWADRLEEAGEVDAARSVRLECVRGRFLEDDDADEDSEGDGGEVSKEDEEVNGAEVVDIVGDEEGGGDELPPPRAPDESSAAGAGAAAAGGVDVESSSATAATVASILTWDDDPCRLRPTGRPGHETYGSPAETLPPRPSQDEWVRRRIRALDELGSEGVTDWHPYDWGAVQGAWEDLSRRRSDAATRPGGVEASSSSPHRGVKGSSASGAADSVPSDESSSDEVDQNAAEDEGEGEGEDAAVITLPDQAAAREPSDVGRLVWRWEDVEAEIGGGAGAGARAAEEGGGDDGKGEGAPAVTDPPNAVHAALKDPARFHATVQGDHDDDHTRRSSGSSGSAAAAISRGGGEGTTVDDEDGGRDRRRGRRGRLERERMVGLLGGRTAVRNRRRTVDRVAPSSRVVRVERRYDGGEEEEWLEFDLGECLVELSAVEEGGGCSGVAEVEGGTTLGEDADYGADVGGRKGRLTTEETKGARKRRRLYAFQSLEVSLLDSDAVSNRRE